MSTEDQMSIEDRVRTATRAGASLIRDVRPLGAPAPVRLRRWPGPAPRRWVNWGVPLAAAAAVAAIALTLVAIRQPGTPPPAASGSGAASPAASGPVTPSPAASGPVTASPAASGSGTPSPAASTSGTAAPVTAPRYYATVVYDAHAGRYAPVIVGDDLTGKVIATVTPPPGLVFTNVRGTSDDRTFVVQAAVYAAPYAWPPATLYLLRIAPGNAHPYQLTELPIKLPDNTLASAYALSPDGRELAVQSTPGNADAKPVITLATYSVSTGAQLHAWTVPTQVMQNLAHRTLSWIYGGRQLVFSATAGSADHLQLRTLDVTGTGTDLMADSRALLTADNPGTSTCDSLQVTPDGGTAICATSAGRPGDPAGNAGCANGRLRFTAFSLPNDPSGKLARVLYQYPGACHDGTSVTLWTDASASSIIGVTSISVATEGGKYAYAFQVGVITGGHFRPLNIAKSVRPGDYVNLAF